MFIYNLLSNNNYLIIIEENLSNISAISLITHVSNLKHVNNTCVDTSRYAKLKHKIPINV